MADDLERRGLGLAAISYDGPEVLRGFAEQYGVTYPMLADPGSEVIERFGLRNPVPEWAFGDNVGDPEVQEAVRTYVSAFGPNERMIGMAFPGTLVLDANGVVVERHFEDVYSERNTISSVLLRGGDDSDPVQAVEVSTLQLELTTYASDAELAPGNRFALVLDIVPNAGMHIYAPGASDVYTAIHLEVEDRPYLRTLPMEFPESTEYYFEPFDDTQPVYEEPFRLVQEAYLDVGPDGRDSITINGVLHYQACDENVCYLPSTIPLTWTVGVTPLVVAPVTRIP